MVTVEDRVKDVEVSQAVMKNDFMHILSKLQDVIDQLRIYNEKIPDIISLDKRITHIENLVNDIYTKQSTSLLGSIKPGYLLWALLVAVAFVTGQADLISQLSPIISAK